MGAKLVVITGDVPTKGDEPAKYARKRAIV